MNFDLKDAVPVIQNPTSAEHLRSEKNFNHLTFKSALKTLLFRQAFNVF